MTTSPPEARVVARSSSNSAAETPVSSTFSWTLNTWAPRSMTILKRGIVNPTLPHLTLIRGPGLADKHTSGVAQCQRVFGCEKEPFTPNWLQGTADTLLWIE